MCIDITFTSSDPTSSTKVISSNKIEWWSDGIESLYFSCWEFPETKHMDGTIIYCRNKLKYY